METRLLFSTSEFQKKSFHFFPRYVILPGEVSRLTPEEAVIFLRRRRAFVMFPEKMKKERR